MIQRAGLNQGIKSLMGGNMSSLMGPAALLGGAVMLGRAFDPTRPGSRNYNPNLSGQIDYLSGIGGMIGFSIGGPIGGILGAIIGSKLSSRDQGKPSVKQRNQAAFFTALFACFAKIAKADGKVTREEVDLSLIHI